MSVSKPVMFGLILLIVVLVIILGFLTNLISLPRVTNVTTTTTTLSPTTTTTEGTTTILTTTVPVTTYKSYCENNTCWLYEGESINATKNNIMYTITLMGVQNENTAIININGETNTFNQGDDKIMKGLGIYLMKVYYLPKEGQSSFVQFLFY